MARKQNVVRMHHGLNLNIGIVIFVIIIIYVIFNLISYLTSSPVAEYEVGQEPLQQTMFISRTDSAR